MLAGIYLKGNAQLNLTVEGEQYTYGTGWRSRNWGGKRSNPGHYEESTGSLTASGGGYGAAGIGGKAEQQVTKVQK